MRFNDLQIYSHVLFVISGLLCHLDEICALMGFTQYIIAIPCRRFGTNYRSHIQRQEALEDCADMVSQKVGKE
jgi:hypothetical protein